MTTSQWLSWNKIAAELSRAEKNYWEEFIQEFWLDNYWAALTNSTLPCQLHLPGHGFWNNLKQWDLESCSHNSPQTANSAFPSSGEKPQIVNVFSSKFSLTMELPLETASETKCNQEEKNDPKSSQSR